MTFITHKNLPTQYIIFDPGANFFGVIPKNVADMFKNNILSPRKYIQHHIIDTPEKETKLQSSLQAFGYSLEGTTLSYIR